MVNVFKSEIINYSDAVTSLKYPFDLDSENQLNKTLIVLYIYCLPKFPTHGYKVGMTICHSGETFWHAIQQRIKNQEHELALSPDQYGKYGQDREVVYWGVCLDAHNDSFKDYYVHDKINMKLAGLVEQNQEWFNGVPLDDLVDAFNECRFEGEERKIYNPRDEQKECIKALTAYFKDNPVNGRFLLNCKMRFGKCYTTYKFCEDNNIDKVLILTFVPAVQDSWQEDLFHIRKEYDYFTDNDLKKPSFDLKKLKNPFVMFLSLQNYLGKDSNSSGTKEKIKKLTEIDFDLVVLDEYHFGAWNDRTQETLEDFEPDYAKQIKKGEDNGNVIKKFGIQTKRTICLSGTPFKALARGEFNQTNSFTYSYFDEQKKKYPKSKNNDFSIVDDRYQQFPDMKIFGYNMHALFKGLTGSVFSDDKLLGKSYFSLNKFFATIKDSQPKSLEDKFIYDEEVKDWLTIIKGQSTYGGDFPYANIKMLNNNVHSLWLMNSINACKAMAKLLKEDEYFNRNYVIVNLSADGVGAGTKALEYLNRNINACANLGRKGTIAITVNKLTIGVTVKPWSSVFVLKDLASPESYFQSIFRIQTPNVDPDTKQILKKEGYVYDFNIDRAAALMLKFAEQSSDRSTPRLEIAKLIVKYMPIFRNGDMQKPIDYETFYQLAMYGDTNGVSLSKRIRDLKTTTRLADDDVLACMLNDPDTSAILKHVFAHAKFTKEKKPTRPVEPPDGFMTELSRKGQDKGHELGVKDYEELIDFDDAVIQEKYIEFQNKHIKETMPEGLDEVHQSYYTNGFIKGYQSGVNAPIKKLQSGKPDGIKFAEKIRKEKGDQFYYEGTNKTLIDTAAKTFLKQPDSIPAEYRKILYKQWYVDSFLKAVRNTLRRPKEPGEGESVEDANNVIQHLISRLFQFLYISVYRETTFDEIFQNADPNTFLEAVGITKKDFETLNRYHAFQEDVLNNYIHEFFVNETLGSKLDQNDEYVKQNYRNSFEWFGYSGEDVIDVIEDYVDANKDKISDYDEAKERIARLREPVDEYADAAPEVKRVAEKIEEIKKIETEKNSGPKSYQLPAGLNQWEEKVLTALYVICDLEKEAQCRPYLKTIKNYLTGNSNSVFYSWFNGKQYCGSFNFMQSFKIERTLNELVRKGFVKVLKEKKDAYYPVDRK